MRDPRDVDGSAYLAEVQAIQTVLAKLHVGEAGIAPRQMADYRDRIRAAIQRVLLPFRPDLADKLYSLAGLEQNGIPRLGVAVDPEILTVALTAYLSEVTDFHEAVGESQGVPPDVIGLFTRRLDALQTLGLGILDAVRPVAAVLTADEIADLETTHRYATGVWGKLSGLLLDVLDLEAEQRRELAAIAKDPG
jgi:hypothetical protein